MALAFSNVNSCIYDNGALVTAVCVKVVKEKESQNRLKHSSSNDSSVLFFSPPLENA